MGLLRASLRRSMACNGSSAQRPRFVLHWEAHFPPHRLLLFPEAWCNLLAQAVDFSRSTMPTPSFRGNLLSPVLSRGCTSSERCGMLNSKLRFPTVAILCDGAESFAPRTPANTLSVSSACVVRNAKPETQLR